MSDERTYLVHFDIHAGEPRVTEAWADEHNRGVADALALVRFTYDADGGVRSTASLLCAADGSRDAAMLVSAALHCLELAENMLAQTEETKPQRAMLVLSRAVLVKLALGAGVNVVIEPR